MSETNTYPPAPSFAEKAHVKSLEQYQAMYDESIRNPDGFWGKIAEEFVWKQKWTQVQDHSFTHPVRIEWFKGGKTNVSVNCLDRHLDARGDQTAIIWEGNEPGEDAKLTYRELHAEVNKFANALKSLGVKKGDRVAIYLQMIPQAAIACLACARIGASTRSSSAPSAPTRCATASRTPSASCSSPRTRRCAAPSATSPMKLNADRAVAQCPSIETVVVVKRTGIDVPMKEGRDVWYEDVMAKADPVCEPEWVDAEDPLFILYTSGSTGKPKGVLHTTGGYMVYAATTFKYIFDYHPGDVWWCTADIGWVTGHSYIVYGPLANGATSIMFEGVPTYPDAGRFWDVVDKYKVTQFYTAPTAIRALMREGDEIVAKRDLSSLKLLGSVGEPINPEVWEWYRDHIGHGRPPWWTPGGRPRPAAS
jgi:acetyl-CoA synthetase